MNRFLAGFLLLWASTSCADDALGTMAPVDRQSLSVHCKSNEFRRARCPVNTAGGVVIEQRLSQAPCRLGKSWGWDERGIWVSRGCEAVFAIAAIHRQPDPRPAQAGDSIAAVRVLCESRNFGYTLCPVNVRQDVELVYQLSKRDCRFNRSWGFGPTGVWVDNGCGGEFAIY